MVCHPLIFFSAFFADKHYSRENQGLRLGYMGHLTLISEDVIAALEHYPEDFTSMLRQFAPQPAWNHYVNGAYRETKNKDTSLLGGGKPALPSGVNFQKGKWAKVDEADSIPINGSNTTAMADGPIRSVSSTAVGKTTADFTSPEEEGSASSSHVGL